MSFDLEKEMTTNIVIGASCIGFVLLFFILALFARHFEGFALLIGNLVAPIPEGSKLYSILRVLGYSYIPLAVMLSYLFKCFRKVSPDASPLQIALHIRAETVITCALFESIALCGFLLFCCSRSWSDFPVFAGISLLLLILAFPILFRAD
ncbi:MAG TPA: hypothetical protein PLU72_14185 [Candidatus Ozemobacteraceae bacterium]|nr:hypothetical protein [Candidatus Ozemobacteraceae bacterium]